MEDLAALGFPEEKINVAMRACDNSTEAAVQFIIDNEDQPERWHMPESNLLITELEPCPSSWWSSQSLGGGTTDGANTAEPEDEDPGMKRTKTIYSAVELLQLNEDAVFQSSVKVLVRVLGNILKDPLEEK